MSPTIFFVFLTAFLGAADSSTNDVKTLIDTIETLQKPIEDFRCEFEGSVHYKGKTAEGFKGKLAEDGLYESFSGIFVWKRGGDIYNNTLNRLGADNTIARETLLVRMQQRQAEEYYRQNDAPLGYSVIKNPKEVRSWASNCLGSIFLINRIKRDVADEGHECSVDEGDIEGRPLKVLAIGLKNVPDSLMGRYWIDLRRNGHVVRMEGYGRDKDKKKVMNGRLDIELAPFKVGSTEVWMPVSGKQVSYVALENKRLIVTKEPGGFDTIKVVNGTMEFNKHPGPEVFTIKYKPGTPISDRLRQLETEFGQQTIGLKPSKADAEKMLNEQVTRAEAQKKELVAVPPSQWFSWSSALIWVMGAAVLLAAGAALWANRRRYGSGAIREGGS